MALWVNGVALPLVRTAGAGCCCLPSFHAARCRGKRAGEGVGPRSHLLFVLPSKHGTHISTAYESISLPFYFRNTDCVTFQPRFLGCNHPTPLEAETCSHSKRRTKHTYADNRLRLRLLWIESQSKSEVGLCEGYRSYSIERKFTRLRIERGRKNISTAEEPPVSTSHSSRAKDRLTIRSTLQGKTVLPQKILCPLSAYPVHPHALESPRWTGHYIDSHPWLGVTMVLQIETIFSQPLQTANRPNNAKLDRG
ncbi:hypothetical protein MGYG_07142 [Nannizzia gypsea CBS 118893]|uniref:Secreted protein n=1 Tax=Arthroderma gypseum (strain ATCC MYA-4604 / CBS 118893) TaxID=535722 RepID=E4V270_ARTGP|nr:hypothetical protein MGYG_07142 [Nannizzia gypsea CBS 118893]EFR04135.1 hypothetical protein MGYG_07142 [Nannizzia gypsea CBS 118893]